MKYFALIATVAMTALMTSRASAQYIPPPVGGGTTIVVQPGPTAPIPSPVPMPGPRY